MLIMEKRSLIATNWVLFVALLALSYFGLFGFSTLLISLVCYSLLVINLAFIQKTIFVIAHVLEGVICIFLFIASGPFVLIRLSDYVNLLQFGIVLLCQIIFLLIITALISKKHKWFRDLVAGEV